MFRRHFLPLLVCGLLVCLSNSSSSADRNYKIWETAKNKIGSTKWSVQNDWRGKSGYVNRWKCNLFVYDVLLKAKAEVPSRRPWGHYPIGANAWANPRSWYVRWTGCYRRVSDNRKRKGDVIAFQRRGASGHMGIVSTYGFYISAGKHTVTETSIKGFLRGNKIVQTTIWRYTC
ncbi:uncharacterized protein LOC130046613 [Ostrea edulis]|uniref:uncharacterized protein LOC130046613 n=1 Tax=Ostrea edulis TaxID=37623 RepID=UPI0024AEF8B9|nr:uncharacterized protein LOC130046613 [Ostrea edulis]